MKFKIFKMLVVLGFLSAMPMIYMGKFDPMEFIDTAFKGGSAKLEKLKSKAPDSLSDVVSDQKVQVYKWRDKNGVMQFSNTPPPDGHAEQIEVNPNDNVVQAVKFPVQAEEVATIAPAKTEIPNPYSVKGMKKVMDDAKGVQDLLDKRQADQQKALGGY